MIASPISRLSSDACSPTPTFNELLTRRAVVRKDALLGGSDAGYRQEDGEDPPCRSELA